MVTTHWANGAKKTSYRRRCDVITSHRRLYDVILCHVPAGQWSLDETCTRYGDQCLKDPTDDATKGRSRWKDRSWVLWQASNTPEHQFKIMAQTQRFSQVKLMCSLAISIFSIYLWIMDLDGRTREKNAGDSDEPIRPMRCYRRLLNIL